MRDQLEDKELSRFLSAWLSVRQLIQAANFNRFHQAGLSATQFMTLNLLPKKGESVSIGELARQMNLKPATVAKTVDSLEERQMLVRGKSAADGRLVMVQITDLGRTLQNAAAGNFREQMRTVFRAIPAADRAALVQGLESLVSAATALKEGPSDTEGVSRAANAAPQAKRSSRRSARP